MTYFNLSRQLKNNDIPLVSLVYGEETFFIQRIKDLFIKQVQTDPANIMTYDLTETPIQDVLADAMTYPFFEGKKLIFAINPVFLQAKAKKLPFEHQLSVLEEYLQAPPNYSIVVFILHSDKIDSRKKITKLLKQKATIALCETVKPHEAEKWVIKIAEDLHVTIEEEALYLLDPDLLTNLQLLESEINKLALYVGKGGVITKDIVGEMVSHTPTSSALRLVDAVMTADLYKAIAIYHDLMKQKEEQIPLIGLLAYQFRMILRVKLLKQKGYTQGQIQKSLGVHPYVVKVAHDRERQFSIKRLKYIINQLAETDAILKQGRMDKNIAFELLLHHLVTYDAK
ncbi:DNA polymerase-3 subunit delta [Cerasibacillus quisquiliarum]|uniref:DNA polymerase III subunit delta n=1 Tax=Cerasibacillus quisquiliarum TaxID=227865 RepID=A0A511UWS4_9BACI|nr:DNA polymerase III subunit delta [Cerasibacillus quisquiliarum]MBB5145560.1 DNA polymerase-3 subunit delta [Cerasibacillus quisquiliarum]GEN31044.1 DNA polymerase III subunit delta [Cerasibacillus quisquiliarum]